MYKLAVCDDEAIETKAICNILKKITPEGIVEISSYLNGKELLDDIKDGTYFDIIMLDISMGELDGVTVARKIREGGICSGSIIFFITSYEADISTIVDLNPMAYIYKPASEESMKPKLKKAFDILKMNGKVLEFVSERNMLRLRLDEIMYIESYSRGVVLYAIHGMYKTSTYKINNVENAIQSVDFVRCHYSYIVNKSYIRRAAMDEIVMYNGQKIPISRKYHDNIFAGIKNSRKNDL